MRKKHRFNATPAKDAYGRRFDLDRRVEIVTQRSLDEMVCILARQANEDLLQHA